MQDRAKDMFWQRESKGNFLPYVCLEFLKKSSWNMYYFCNGKEKLLGKLLIWAA